MNAARLYSGRIGSLGLCALLIEDGEALRRSGPAERTLVFLVRRLLT